MDGWWLWLLQQPALFTPRVECMQGIPRHRAATAACSSAETRGPVLTTFCTFSVGANGFLGMPPIGGATATPPFAMGGDHGKEFLLRGGRSGGAPYQWQKGVVVRAEVTARDFQKLVFCDKGSSHGHTGQQ